LIERRPALSKTPWNLIVGGGAAPQIGVNCREFLERKSVRTSHRLFHSLTSVDNEEVELKLQ